MQKPGPAVNIQSEKHLPPLHALRELDLRNSPFEIVRHITPESFTSLEHLNLYFIGALRNPFDLHLKSLLTRSCINLGFLKMV